MNIINNLRDLDELTAGAWFHWEGNWATTWEKRYVWEPAPFSTCPAASYALRQKMRADDFAVRLSGVKEIWAQAWDTNGLVNEIGEAFHPNECTAIALAALRALGVEFTLAEGWDK